MASYNVQMNMLNKSGGYDIIYPEINCRKTGESNYILTNGILRNYTTNTIINDAINLGSLSYIRLSSYSNGIFYGYIQAMFKDGVKNKLNTTDLFMFTSNDVYSFLGEKETISNDIIFSNGEINLIDGEYWYNEDSSIIRCIFYFAKEVSDFISFSIALVQN